MSMDYDEDSRKKEEGGGMWNVSGKVGPPELSGEKRSEVGRGMCAKSEI